MENGFKRSPLALAILGVLAAGPLHPYGIQRRLKDWGKEDVVNVGQRASLYKTIARLADAGLVTSQAAPRDTAYPERTVYAITAEGDEAARRWAGDMIAVPRNEFPEFPAALSFVPMLTPAELRAHLVARRDALDAAVAGLRAEPAVVNGYRLPPVSLLDARYREAVLAAERRWVAETLSDLDTGELGWDRDTLIGEIPDVDS